MAATQEIGVDAAVVAVLTFLSEKDVFSLLPSLLAKFKHCKA